MEIKSQAWTVWTVKVRTLIDKEWGPIICDGDMWKDCIESENVDLSDSQGFISLTQGRGLVSPPTTEFILPPLLPETLLFTPLPEDINPSLSAKTAVAFSVENARQYNSYIPQGPPIVALQL